MQPPNYIKSSKWEARYTMQALLELNLGPPEWKPSMLITLFIDSSFQNVIKIPSCVALMYLQVSFTIRSLGGVNKLCDTNKKGGAWGLALVLSHDTRVRRGERERVVLYCWVFEVFDSNQILPVSLQRKQYFTQGRGMLLQPSLYWQFFSL